MALPAHLLKFDALVDLIVEALLREHEDVSSSERVVLRSNCSSDRTEDRPGAAL